jgi:diadenylate cyclase
MLRAFFDLGLADVFDIAVVAVLAWVGLVLLRRTQARMALLGLAMLGVVYIAARQLGLQLTAAILQGFFAVLVLVLVVVFQDDLRRFFEQIAALGLRRRRAPVRDGVEDVLVRAVNRLAKGRVGALLVLPGLEPIERHVDGGIELGGRVSEALLLSLFDPGSPGHDGAVMVRGGLVERFAVHLPLSSDHAQLQGLGTRHAAALGLTERSDALCVVVSEERGTVSVARRGVLRRLPRSEDLGHDLRALAAELAPALPAGRRWSLAVRGLPIRGRDAALALAVAFSLWLLFVPGGAPILGSFQVPVVVDKLPPGWALESVEPAEVTVTLAGPRREVYLAGRTDLSVHVDPLLVQLGRRTFQLDADAVRHARGLSVVGIEPQSVRLSVRREPAGPAAGGTGDAARSGGAR